MRQRNTLWTKNFTIITLGTIISAIGGTAMNFVMGLVVFDNTDSAWMTGFFSAVSILPSVILPVLVAPYMDSHRRKPFIVYLDAALGILYLLFFVYIRQAGFVYAAYMVFSVITSAIGSVYSTAYSAFYPDLIEEGFLQKGYSISSIIYPTVTVLVTPLAALVYTHLDITTVFLAEGILLLIASGFESRIDAAEKHAVEKKRFSFQAYGQELLGGVRYLKKEKGIRNLYINMSVINATSSGTSLMIMTFFQSSTILTTAMYSFLISMQTLGRMLGGILHYTIKIPRRLRFPITKAVYLLYQVFDGLLLFLPYPAMLGIQFACGFMGVNTATMREAAIQHHLPSGIRARVVSLFSVIISAGIMVMDLLAGALGEIMPYRMVALLLSGLGLLSILLLIVKGGRKHIEPLFDVEF